MPTDEDLPLLYLAAEDVVALYAEIFELSIEEAGDRLRNKEGFRSALNRPTTYAHYQRADVALQAAVLAHAIAEGRHFLDGNRSEEHTSELQSHLNLVCRLLLEKKNTTA